MRTVLWLHMADKDEILKLREEYDDLAVVCYINSTAELRNILMYVLHHLMQLR